jgi:hypothetical protein
MSAIEISAVIVNSSPIAMAPSEPPFWLEKLEKQKKVSSGKILLQRKKTASGDVGLP